MGTFDVRRGDTFVELLDVIDTAYPPGRGRIIMEFPRPVGLGDCGFRAIVIAQVGAS